MREGLCHDIEAQCIINYMMKLSTNLVLTAAVCDHFIWDSINVPAYHISILKSIRVLKGRQEKEKHHTTEMVI